MWGRGKRDEGLEDIKYGTRRRVGRGRGGVKTGTQGTRDVNNYCKKKVVNTISVTFLVNMFW